MFVNVRLLLYAACLLDISHDKKKQILANPGRLDTDLPGMEITNIVCTTRQLLDVVQGN